MPSDDVAISVRNLTKTYRLFGHPGDRVKQFLSLGLKRYHNEFTALKDVSFDIKKGQTVGIIGRNGSGKSTLLQLICGILKPTSGTVKANGRVSALLELGAGFNPEFTGRENVYFHGALMGLTKTQMHERINGISAFADIGAFLDQPVRTYSSGMFVRLAFAVAVHVDPEILVVDEALAVGDSAFQVRCLARIDVIRKRGGTILLVTHALEQVAHHCNRAIVLDGARILEDADTPRALARYQSLLRSPEPREAAADSSTRSAGRECTADLFANHPAYNPAETRWGDLQAVITDIQILQRGLENPDMLIPGLATEIRMRVEYHADIEQPIYGLAIKSHDGAILFAANSRDLLAPLKAPRQLIGDVTRPRFVFTPIFRDGDYFVSVGVASQQGGNIVPHDRRYDSIILRIATPDPGTANIDMSPVFTLMEEP